MHAPDDNDKIKSVTTTTNRVVAVVTAISYACSQVTRSSRSWFILSLTCEFCELLTGDSL